jgi:hypothetical protein
MDKISVTNRWTQNGRDQTHFHLNYHLHLARVFNARGETAFVEQQLRLIISLVVENKSSIHDWRPVFLSILEQFSKRLKVLHPKTGKKRLVKAFADLAMVKAQNTKCRVFVGVVWWVGCGRWGAVVYSSLFGIFI